MSDLPTEEEVDAVTRGIVARNDHVIWKMSDESDEEAYRRYYEAQRGAVRRGLAAKAGWR